MLQGSFTSHAEIDCANGLSSFAALPHPEVPTAEFYKHISADLTEPRRMRCLLGWCGSRALPAKPDAPKDSSKEANAEFQALQAGMQRRLFLYWILEYPLIFFSPCDPGRALSRFGGEGHSQRLVFKGRRATSASGIAKEAQSAKYCKCRKG